MEISHLKEFTVLAQRLNFQTAADELSVSSSALSRHIRAIEDELDAVLFDRTTRHVTLTEYGASFLEYAKRALAEYGNMRDDLRRIKNKQSEILFIGANYRINELVAEFAKVSGHVSVRITEQTSEAEHTTNTMRLLLDEKISLAFMWSDEFPHSDIEQLCLYRRDTLAVILPSGHRLAGKASLSIDELRGENWITFPEESFDSSLISRMCMEAGFKPNVVLNGYRGTDIAGYVASGLGISILWKQSSSHFMRPSLAAVDLVPSCGREVYLCKKRGTKLSPTEKLFVDFVMSKAESPAKA